MLGFELAGIILAIIPLYDEAVTIAGVKKMVEANRERRQIAGKLLVVNASLRHATLRLFHKLDPDLTLDQWDALEVQGVTGSKFLDIWREISEACPAVRNEELWLAIEETLKNVATALVKVLKHTKIEDAATGLREIITEHEKNPKPFSKGSVFERFMFGASDRNRSRQLKDLSEATGNLLMFTKFVAAENRDTRAHSRAASENHKRYVRDLNNVRTHCRKLYGCLFNHWKCECHLSRRAMLKLENRTSDINLHFSIILAFENPSDDCWGYQKTRISIYDPYASPTILMLTFSSAASTKKRELLTPTIDDWLTVLTRHQISRSWEAFVTHCQTPPAKTRFTSTLFYTQRRRIST